MKNLKIKKKKELGLLQVFLKYIFIVKYSIYRQISKDFFI